MDIKVIKELTKLMRENELVEVEVESADLKVKLRKAGHQGHPAVIQHQAMPTHAAPVAGIPAPAAAIVNEFAGCKEIMSPIPGTVYLKANPDSASFVTVGAQIDEAKVVCLIEAMKVFNEIKPDAGITGTIKKICVNDGQPVEYGTVLFLVG